jgi:hypothetical protein
LLTGCRREMIARRRKSIGFAIVAIVLVAVAYRYFGTHNVPAGQPALVTLDAGSLDALRADFNRSAGETRIVILLSPT